MTYQPQPTNTSGTKTQTAVSDDDANDTLVDILLELKKMNLYLSIMSGVALDDRSVE